MLLRAYRPADCPRMARLFYDTVHTVNAADYTPQQLDAWADGRPDLAAWDRSFRRHCTLLAEEDGTLAGFADMAPDGYLDRLYVHREFQRRGVAAALCSALESQIPGPWTTYASITARPFFLARGYRMLQARQVERHGVLLTNYWMVKDPPAAD